MNPRVFISLMLILGVPVTAGSATPSPLIFESGPARVSMLEVYSSEGCSSCPPAEQWLTEQMGSRSLWKNAVPACFHVDYWDYLGWKDKLASPRFTSRQRQRGGASIYTPGFFLNGQEWRGWFDGERDLPVTADSGGRLHVEWLPNNTAVVQFQPAQPGDQWTVEAAILGMGIVSDIRAGENRGRTLQHDFAVVSIAQEKMVEKNRQWTARVSVPAPSVSAPRYAVAIWVSSQNVPVQATGGWLVR